MPRYDQLEKPTDGTRIEFGEDGGRDVPSDPIIPFIEGDGTGPDIWAAARRVLDASVETAYKGKRRIHWYELFAGERAVEKYGEGQWLPEDTLQAIQEYGIAIKGPLTTPVGGGYRSLNVALRQTLDLFACVRPVRWIPGVPTPVVSPERLDIVIFRENTEDLFAGLEWPSGSDEAKRLIRYLREELGVEVRRDAGIGIKPISATATKRLVRAAIRYALDNRRDSVTLVHKGNIMKFTEGAFRDWGYQLAKDEFPDVTLTEQEVLDKHGGKVPKGTVMIKDRIADAMFQQVLLRPEEYSVVVTPNLNGDYLSDACAAQVGGLGMAPGANLGDRVALFEATHGTAPKYAGQDKVNPGSVILSGKMMLEHLGWKKAAGLVAQGIEGAIGAKKVTYDLERQMKGAKLLKCSEFADAIIGQMTT